MYQQYINGKLVDGLGKPLDVLDPSTGEVVGTVGSANAAQAQQALDAAAEAFKTWSKTPLQTRIDWMLKLREACLAERETLVELVSRESGRTYALACGDFDWCMTSFQYYAEEVKRIYGTSFPNAAGTYGSGYHIVERRPMGVSVGHLAWNYPLGNAGLKIAPAVVSGCCCIIKPSSQTPLATLYLGVIAEKIGFPAGVINIISGPAGEVGKTLNSSSIPKLITLIGSSETGLQIMREGATSVKKYSFELGGNAPVIPMQPFKTLDEAIEKANNTIYGLSSYFFGHNAKEISKAFEGMEAGEIFINGSGGTEQVPHAGVKQSGVGCDKSPWSLEEYFDFKYCAMIP